VALLARGHSPVRTYFEQVATRAGLTLFSRDYAPDSAPFSAIERPMHRPGEMGKSHWGHAPSQRHWGINE
jgi:hypothetical protein